MRVGDGTATEYTGLLEGALKFNEFFHMQLRRRLYTI